MLLRDSQSPLNDLQFYNHMLQQAWLFVFQDVCFA